MSRTLADARGTAPAGDRPDADPAAVAARLARLRAHVADCAQVAGRHPDDVTIVAITKTWPAAVVAAAARAGHREFGENRARELRDKSRDAALGEFDDLVWHFVGRLQTNKVKYVVGTCALVHSLDRWDLAVALEGRGAHNGVVQDALVQVNVDGDPAKAGVAPAELPGFLARVADLKHVRIRGLMTLPALDGDARAAFRTLRQLRDAVGRDHPDVQHLSMGMSRDYPQAIAEGATMVRLGEAVFGPRGDPHTR